MKVLELFAGTRSISRAFEERGHETFSVEWDKKFNDIDMYADISRVTANDIIEKFGHPDVIWASPDCFPAGALIWTDKGYKNVEDINCFDNVLTHKNRYRKVYATQKTNKHDLYKIKISGCEPVNVTSEHPYYVRKKKDIYGVINGKKYRVTDLCEPEWIKAKDLTKEYRVGIPINTNSIIPEWNGCVYYTKNLYGITSSRIVNNYSKYMSDPDFWWLVGRYFGDGYMSKEKATIEICCAHEEDVEIAPVLNRLQIKYTKRIKPTTTSFIISSKELCTFLEQFGVGAKNKSITPTILDLPVNLLKQFVDGYISADGHWNYSYKNPCCTITTISKKLAYGFQMCILKAYKRYGSLIVRNNTNNNICGRKVNTNIAYTVGFYRDETNRLQYCIEDNIAWVNIREVKHLPSHQTSVYNISVEEDESYTANNIIVHNCSSYSVAAISRHRRKNKVTGNLDPISDYAKFCDETNKHMIELIKELNPKYYFIENPRGAFRKMDFIQGIPRYTVTYCQYGEKRQKPTDIFTNHPDPQFAPPASKALRATSLLRGEVKQVLRELRAQETGREYPKCYVSI